MDIAILGAGISGISLHNILKNRYSIDADIYEKENRVGGLCRSESVKGFTYDISGGHVLNSKDPEVLDFVFNACDKSKFNYHKRYAKILFNDLIIDYPFEFSLHKLPKQIRDECIESLKSRIPGESEPDRFGDLLKYNFGDKIYDYYLKPYNEKIWKYDLQKISSDWVKGKMPYPDTEEIIAKTEAGDSTEISMVHSSFYYPKFGGIESFIKSISSSIPTEHIGESVTSVELENEKVIINGKAYDLVVNTMPVPELVKLIHNVPESVTDAAAALRYNSFLSLLYETDEDYDNCSWLYIPDKKIIPHRIVYQSNFSSEKKECGKKFFTVEVTGSEPFDIEEIQDNINTYLHFDSPLAVDYTEYAYVIFDHKRGDSMDIITNYLEEGNILSHGRFAEWKYPNMDTCIRNSMNLAEKIAEKQ